MKKKVTRPHIKEEEFKKIKSLIELDIPLYKIGKIMDRSAASVARVELAKDWSDFQERKRIFSEKQYAERLAKEGKPVVSEVDKTAEALAAIPKAPKDVRDYDIFTQLEEIKESQKLIMDILGIAPSKASKPKFKIFKNS